MTPTQAIKKSRLPTVFTYKLFVSCPHTELKLNLSFIYSALVGSLRIRLKVKGSKGYPLPM